MKTTSPTPRGNPPLHSCILMLMIAVAPAAALIRRLTGEIDDQ